METSALTSAEARSIDPGFPTALWEPRSDLQPWRRTPRQRPARAARPALVELARLAGYRLERARAPGFVLLIDSDGELVRTPQGTKAWSLDAAERRLRAVAPCQI